METSSLLFAIHSAVTGTNGEVPLKPSPSLQRSADGRPSRPGPGYAVHFPRPSPGVLPSWLAVLKRWAAQNNISLLP
jgi:hypothetical protein